jgi:PIN domain nuclease of toxin-antitoxin system
VIVFDASALLAFLQGEEGSATVEDGLRDGSACSTANWSEVAQKIRAHGRDWPLARALLASYGLRLEPVTVEDAEQAALTWTRGSGMSLADRLCLALGERSDAIVWTADASWGTSESIRQIR